jgi:hypothetical protein
MYLAVYMVKAFFCIKAIWESDGPDLQVKFGYEQNTSTFKLYTHKDKWSNFSIHTYIEGNLS